MFVQRSFSLSLPRPSSLGRSLPETLLVQSELQLALDDRWWVTNKVENGDVRLESAKSWSISRRHPEVIMMSSLKNCVFYIFWLWSNLIKFVYANHQAKHLLVSECEFEPTRQVFIRCNITPLIGNSNTNGNYWMWWNFWLNPKLLPVRLMLAPKSKTMRSLKRKSPARKSMCVPHSALLSGKHPRPLLEQHSASHTHTLCATSCSKYWHRRCLCQPLCGFQRVFSIFATAALQDVCSQWFSEKRRPMELAGPR